MKLTKRLFALLICAVMLATSCVFANAATASVTMSKTGGHNITSGGEVVWTEYSVTGGNTGHTEEVNILEFNPKDGYLPMVFQRNAGSVNKLSSEYTGATTKYGYEVAGMINGSFFGMANSSLVGMIISNGRIMCTHNDYSDSVVAFDSEGRMHIVDSKLEFKLYIKGQEFSNAIRYINKRFETDGWASGLFYYYDTSCGTLADSADTGYEIVCKKVNNSDLMVGGTLFAEVIEVKKDQGPTKFDTVGEESENFVLYLQPDSPYVPYVKDLKAGDSIAISANETIAASREIMETANSVITNVGTLVKDGVDLTETNSTIGSHNVNTTYARWTAFGTKPDGSYVFLVSDGASTGSSGRSLSLREIAATMIKLGCTNVIRMDGGGSSSMYTSNYDGNGTPGYIYYSEDRAVADCIMIVKKTSMEDKDLTAALKTAIADAKKSVEATPNASLSAIIADAEKLVAGGTVLESDARAMIAKLSGKGELKDLINQASSVSYKDYSETVLTTLRAAYSTALKVYFDNEATAKEIGDATSVLAGALNKSAYINLSYGKSYTTTKPNRNDSWDDDGTRLTNGSKSNKDPGTNAYSGWGTAATGGSIDVTVDLGSSVESDTYTVYSACKFWGIQALKSMKISVSEDGKTFTSVGESKTITNLGNGVDFKTSDGGSETSSLYSVTYKADSAQKARYVKFTFTANPFVWIDEVEVGIGNDDSGESVGDAVEIHGFNQYVYDSNCFIYTPDFGTLTASKINHKYTTNVILEATDDPDVWTVVSVQKCTGSAPDVTLKDNQIMIACHNGATAASKVSEGILKAAKAGQTLRFYGFDIANKTIGVAAYATVDSGMLGDINDDGEIDQYDYILAKRAHFNTVTLTADQKTRGDVDKDGDNDQYDYILVKRHHFGTYTIG